MEITPSLAKNRKNMKLLKKKNAPSLQIAPLRPPFISIYNNLNKGFKEKQMRIIMECFQSMAPCHYKQKGKHLQQ